MLLSVFLAVIRTEVIKVWLNELDITVFTLPDFGLWAIPYSRPMEMGVLHFADRAYRNLRGWRS